MANMYSSTTLSGPAKSGCWKQLDYAEANTPSLFPLEYRSYLGQAAHAVLQYCAERKADTEAAIRKTAEEVGDLLIREGRDFRGHQEPPLPADDVWLGVDLAVQYLMARPLPLEADALYPERDWTHPRLPYRALIDLVTVQDEGDEEYERRVVEVTDYKSSWQAGEDEINTFQRWGQAVCVWRWATVPMDSGDAVADVIRQRVVNLRTWGEWTRDISLVDPGAEFTVADLEKWEQRIESLCHTADSARIRIDGDVPSSGARPANPGVGCLSCAWRHVCEDAWPTEQAGWVKLSTEEQAAMYARLKGQVSMLSAMIKEADVEKPIAIPGGWVGFQEKVSRSFIPGKERAILDEWLERTGCDIPEADMPVLVSLMASLKLGKGNLDSLAKALMPERAKGIGQVRDDYVESLTTEKRYSQFGVWEDG